jgi:hypothetical protein
MIILGDINGIINIDEVIMVDLPEDSKCYNNQNDIND